MAPYLPLRHIKALYPVYTKPNAKASEEMEGLKSILYMTCKQHLLLTLGHHTTFSRILSLNKQRGGTQSRSYKLYFHPMDRFISLLHQYFSGLIDDI